MNEELAATEMTCAICSSRRLRDFGSKAGYRMIECRDCGLVAVSPMPDAEEIAAFYQDYHKSAQYRAKLGSKVRRARRRIRRVGGRGRGRRFLDVGCNAGFAVSAAASLGYHATGIDVDGEAVAWAAEHFPEAHFEAVSVEALARRGEVYDLIYCSEVIEHLPALDGFVQALRELMHADSRLFLTTPDLGHYSLRKPFSRRSLLDWDAVRPPEHLYYFNRANLRELFLRHGFRRVSCAWNSKPTIKAVIRL
jgi:SAM-dependent methyltransferase